MGDNRGGVWHARLGFGHDGTGNQSRRHPDRYAKTVNSLIKRGILQPLALETMRPCEDAVLMSVDADYARETNHRTLTRGEVPMQNIRLNVTDDDRLIIEVQLKEGGKGKDKIKFTPSASGKTIVGASTRGNVAIPDTDWFLGLNLYKYPDAD